LMGSTVLEIGGDRVRLEQGGQEVVLPNDGVIVLAGGVLPTEFLRSAGIGLDRHFGKRVERSSPSEPGPS